MAALERGDLVFMDFNPQSGREQAGHRPALVLSKASFNQAVGFAFVCPITTQKKGYPFEVEIPDGLAITGVALVDHTKSLDCASRNIKVKDKAPKETVRKCMELLHTILSLDD